MSVSVGISVSRSCTSSRSRSGRPVTKTKSRKKRSACASPPHSVNRRSRRSGSSREGSRRLPSRHARNSAEGTRLVRNDALWTGPSAKDRAYEEDRKSGASEKSVSVPVELGGGRVIKKKKQYT